VGLAEVAGIAKVEPGIGRVFFAFACGASSLPAAGSRKNNQTRPAGAFSLHAGKARGAGMGVPDQPDICCIDVHHYRVLFERAVQTVLVPIQQSVTGGVDSECLYLFPVNKAETLGEGGTQRLGRDNLSSNHNSFKVIR